MMVGCGGFDKLLRGQAVPASLVIEKHDGPDGFLLPFIKWYSAALRVEGSAKGHSVVGAFGLANVGMTVDHSRMEILGFG